MRVSIEAPEIAAYPGGFPAFWSRALPFFGEPISRSYQVHALAGTYVRLVEVALAEYRNGCMKLREFWDTQDSFNITAFNQSISHFETCVVSMHRAINCYRRLRRNKDSDPLALELNRQKPAFASDPIADRLRDIRHEVHHLDERLVEGTIQEGQSFALRPDGPERVDPTDAGMKIKSFDRLAIGSKELLFTELVAWLTEMCGEAQRIAKFEPNVPRPHRAGSA